MLLLLGFTFVKQKIKAREMQVNNQRTPAIPQCTTSRLLSNSRGEYWTWQKIIICPVNEEKQKEEEGYCREKMVNR